MDAAAIGRLNNELVSGECVLVRKGNTCIRRVNLLIVRIAAHFPGGLHTLMFEDRNTRVLKHCAKRIPKDGAIHEVCSEAVHEKLNYPVEFQESYMHRLHISSAELDSQDGQERGTSFPGIHS